MSTWNDNKLYDIFDDMVNYTYGLISNMKVSAEEQDAAYTYIDELVKKYRNVAAEKQERDE